MTKLHAPLALALCGFLAACGGGTGQSDEASSSSQLNSGNVLQALAVSGRALDSVLTVNQLFPLASLELLTELPTRTSGACSGGGDFSYTSVGQVDSLRLNQCQLTNYRYRKGTLTMANHAGGSTLTLLDIGFDSPKTGHSFDVSGSVVTTQGNGQQASWKGDIQIAAGTHRDSWKYTLQNLPAGADGAVSGELSLQSSRLGFPLTVRWLAGSPSLVIQAPDGSSVTIVANGSAQLRSVTGATSQRSFTEAELQDAMKAWTY